MLEVARGLDGWSAIVWRKEAPAASRFSKRLTRALAKWTCSQAGASRQARALVSNSRLRVASRMVSCDVGIKNGDDSGGMEEVTPPHPQRELIRQRANGNHC